MANLNQESPTLQNTDVRINNISPEEKTLGPDEQRIITQIEEGSSSKDTLSVIAEGKNVGGHEEYNDATQTLNYQTHYIQPDSLPNNASEEINMQSAITTESPEVVGGLALTWENTLSYYRDSGNTEMIERILSFSRPNYYPVESHMVVGENHIKFVQDPEVEKGFQDRLRQADIIILESDTRASSFSPQPSFMQEAQQYALGNNKELHILDPDGSDSYIGTLNPMYIQNLFDKGNFGISPDENAYAQVLASLVFTHNLFPLDTEKILNVRQKLINEISALVPESSLARIITDRAILTFLHAGQDSEGTKDLLTFYNSYMKLFIENARNQEFQKQLKSIKTENPNKRLFIVVGNDHSEPLVRTLEDDSYAVPTNYELRDKMRESLHNLTDLSRRSE